MKKQAEEDLAFLLYDFVRKERIRSDAAYENEEGVRIEPPPILLPLAENDLIFDGNISMFCTVANILIKCLNFIHRESDRLCKLDFRTGKKILSY